MGLDILRTQIYREKRGTRWTELVWFAFLHGRNGHYKSNWLVVWNINFIFPFSWEFHHPN